MHAHSCDRRAGRIEASAVGDGDSKATASGAVTITNSGKIKSKSKASGTIPVAVKCVAKAGMKHKLKHTVAMRNEVHALR
jgi:hypothetical protein